MSFAEQLKAARARLGLTQAEADALLDLGKGQCAAWESERNTPLLVKRLRASDRKSVTDESKSNIGRKQKRPRARHSGSVKTKTTTC